MATGDPETAIHSDPKPLDEDLDFFGLSHVGNVRKENQDAFLYATLHKAMHVGGTNIPNPELLEMPSQRLASFGIVADGVGGRSGGERASRAAIEAVARYILHTLETFYTRDSTNEPLFVESLKEAAALTHEAVLEEARKTGDARGPATTLTMIIAAWPNLYTLHVGDSRCYLFREGQLIQLTKDQTMAQDLVDQGALPAEHAARSPFSRILSSSLGGPSSKPVVGKHGIQAGDMVVMCSDGLTKHVSDEQIVARLAALESSEQACRQLVQDALDGGGTDNITVLVLRAIVRRPPETA